MRIMLIGAESDIASGAFRCLAEMAKFLIEMQHKVLVVLPNKGSGETLLKEYKIDYKIIKQYGIVGESNFKSKLKFIVKHALNILLAKRKIDKLLINEKPDIIHMNSGFTYFTAYCAEKLKIPFTWHLRDIIEDYNAIWLNKRMAINLINKSKKIITVSDCVYGKYKNILDQSKMIRVYDGIDVDKFYQKREIFNRTTKKFLFVGGIYKHKGQKEIVEILSEMKKTGMIDNFAMKIAGGGTTEAVTKLINIIKNNHMEDYIQYVGKIENVQDLYKDSDVVFMNSYREAFGRVTAEGMAAGCLVIGANRGGTKELLSDDCGVLYEYGNKESIKNAIMKIFTEEKEMQAIAKKGQQRAKEMFDSKINAKKMNDIFMNEIYNNKK